MVQGLLDSRDKEILKIVTTEVGKKGQIEEIIMR